jgi:uncharacterized protein (DUF2336 family)
MIDQLEGIDDATLAENARTKGQGHLLAISGRSVLTEIVTDVLVVRGNHQVVVSTVDNRGAKFSTSGMSTQSSGPGIIAI